MICANLCIYVKITVSFTYNAAFKNLAGTRKGAACKE